MSDLAYTDGYLGTAQKTSIVPQASYPFGGNPTPDTFHRRYSWQYQVAPGSFAPRIAARNLYSNQLLWSEDYTNAYWTKSLCTVSPGVGQNPVDGARTMSYLYEATGTSEHRLDVSVTAAAVPMVLTAYLTASGRSWAMLRFLDSAAVGHFLFVNLLTGQAGSSSVLTDYKIRSAGFDSFGQAVWQVILFFTPSAGAGTLTVNIATADTVISYAGNPSFAAIGVFDVEFYAGSTIGPYIPTTSVARTVLCPDLDSNDPTCMLVAESDPVLENSARAVFTRTFARLPTSQIFPGAKYITRPPLHDVKSGTAYGVCFEDDKRFSWIFTSRKTISSIAGLADATSAATSNKAPLPGGQTVNCRGTTGSSSFTTSSSVTAIQTALQAAWVNANVPVLVDAYSINAQMLYSGTGGGIIVEISTASTTIEINGQPDNFEITARGTNDAATTPPNPSIRNVAATAHGGSVGHRVALWRGDRLISVGTVVTVPDANNFSVELDTIPGKDEVVTHCGFSANAASCVVNGTIMCSIRRTQRYYLPGYSTGITTFADIPAAASQMDPISWLAAIIAGSAWAVESVGDLAPAQGLGPMLMQETLEVQMSDAIDTVTP